VHSRSLSCPLQIISCARALPFRPAAAQALPRKGWARLTPVHSCDQHGRRRGGVGGTGERQPHLGQRALTGVIIYGLWSMMGSIALRRVRRNFDRTEGGPRSRLLAVLCMSSLEGAIVLCRVRRDLAPLDAVVAELAASRRGGGQPMIGTRCPECGYEYDRVDPATLGPQLEQVTARFERGLTTGEADRLRRRVDPDVWSPLEYACHVRDVLLIQRDRLFLALVEDTPSFARMHRDERVDMDGYQNQDPERVAKHLTVAAELAGRAFARVPREKWGRSLIYNWPEPRELDIRWLAAHTGHEAVHHLADFQRGLASRE
jgi:hypothetical protein